MSVRNLLIFGPPGAGKGTQAKRLTSELSLIHVSTGDMFREHLRNDTSLGLRVKEILAAGDLVSDEITNEMVRERMSREDARSGVLLDGFPRNVPQAEFLQDLLADAGTPLEAVIVLHLAEGELIRRLGGRAKKEGRADDADAAVIQNRIDTYRRESEPCIDYYRHAGVTVLDIDGLGTIDQVSERILGALA